MDTVAENAENNWRLGVAGMLALALDMPQEALEEK